MSSIFCFAHFFISSRCYGFVNCNLKCLQYIFSATTSGLEGMLLGRFFVGTGMGLGPPVAALYVSEV